ncbi:alcohol dehydrogenase GroES-like domain-containing protein [Hypoxylon trugodes]|uniref:alcohol dehydrogenase GroES-like domain-containing protein n=1 Tax=Hypoxylon trugodes TaxID=326681 RepID=UPI0021A0B674|nr:alcohol dehydrogenase GroES-like domain-containing protein [Hypoxylon trugodes]KAI1392617.1 alcohol dehydrogenase GroES-like domain-containing protein [Hypoxylon trugodes]
MKLRKALVGSSVGKYALVDNAEVPAVKPSMMLCRVAAVAVNPADAKMIDYSPSHGSIGGCDFAGEVVEIGTNITRFKTGDRVFGLAFGLNPDDKNTGAFSEYTLATEDLTYHMPAWMTFEEASTFPTAVGTGCCSLYSIMGLPMPDDPAKAPFYVLVSGGATASGLMAIQLLKLSGLKPIATCSPGSMEKVKSAGAIKTFDYHSPSCGMEIRNYTKNSLEYALDCITTPETMSMCYEAIRTSGGRYTALDPPSIRVKYTRRDVYADWVLAFTLFGDPVKFPGLFGRPATSLDRQLARKFAPTVERLVEEGLLKPPELTVRGGGLEALEVGIDDVRKGLVRGSKLVYPLA